MLNLFDYFRSSACYRVRIALNLKNLPYQKIPIHLINDGGEQFKEQYQLINPQNLVPALQDGNKIITQSLAIIEYIDELHPEPPLLPKTPFEKALVRSFALSIVADIHPLNNLRVLKYLSQELDISEEQKNRWYQHWINKGLIALEAKINSLNTKTDFCFGEQPSMADVCLIPQLYNAKRFSCDLRSFPTLLRIDAHCQNHSAFTNAFPVEATM